MQKPKKPSAYPKVTVEFQRKVKAAQVAFRLSLAETELAQATLKAIVTKAAASVGADTESSAVCVDCGAVSPRPPQPSPCPACTKAPAPPAAPAP